MDFVFDMDISQDDSYYNDMMKIIKYKSAEEDQQNEHQLLLENGKILLDQFFSKVSYKSAFGVKNNNKFKSNYLDLELYFIIYGDKCDWYSLLELTSLCAAVELEEYKYEVQQTIPTNRNPSIQHNFINNEFELTITPVRKHIEYVWNIFEFVNKSYEIKTHACYRDIKNFISKEFESTYRFRRSQYDNNNDSVYDIKHCSYGYSVDDICDEYIKGIDVKYAREMSVSVTPSAKISTMEIDDHINRSYIYIHCKPNNNIDESEYVFRMSKETSSKKKKPTFKLEFEIDEHQNNKITFNNVYDMISEFLSVKMDDLKLGSRPAGPLDSFEFELPKYNYSYKCASINKDGASTQPQQEKIKYALIEEILL